MSKIKKFVKRHLFNFCLYGTIIGSTYFVGDVVSKKEHIAAVPLEVRNELYYKDILDDYTFFDTYGRYTSSGAQISNATYTDRLFDKYVTYEKLKELDSIEIHMRNVNDLLFLKKCPNIKALYIDEAETLTDEDIDLINNSDVFQVFLTFNYDNVVRIKENKFDLSRFKKNITINNCFYEFTNDIEQVTIYNYLINYNKNMFADLKSYDHVKEIDDYLDKVIEEYQINDGKDDMEKVVLISNYICNSMEYDKDVSRRINNYIEKRNNGEKAFYTSDEKILDYNYHSITSVINQEDEVKQGVCINYATLFDVLCYKVGIKSRMIDGLDKSSFLGHAWNIVYLNNKRECIDLTFYDGIEYGSDFLEQYYKTRDTLSYSVIEQNLFRDLDKDYSNFSFSMDIDDIDKKPEKINTYIVNEELDKYPVINRDIDLKRVLLLFALGGGTSIMMDEIKDKKDKVLKLTSKK